MDTLSMKGMKLDQVSEHCVSRKTLCLPYIHLSHPGLRRLYDCYSHDKEKTERHLN